MSAAPPIDRIDLFVLPMRLVFPFETSFGKTEIKEALLVRARGGGLDGWGEVTTQREPAYSSETTETALFVLREFLAPALLRAKLSLPADLDAALAAVRGHRMAKAGLEGAVRDRAARAAGLSMSSHLGGTKDRIPSGVSLGIEASKSDLLRRVADFAARGYARVKLKIKPGWDEEVLAAVRKEHPDLALSADANGAYTPGDFDLLARLDRFGLTMLEQPLAHDDLVDHAALQARIRTPICLDESIPNEASFRAAVALGSCRILNVKSGRVGGLGTSVRLHHLAHEHGLPAWCGGMLETGVGRAANVALASLPHFTLPNDISGSDRYYRDEVVDPPFRVDADGTISVPRGPGLGVTVLATEIERRAIRKESVAA